MASKIIGWVGILLYTALAIAVCTMSFPMGLWIKLYLIGFAYTLMSVTARNLCGFGLFYTCVVICWPISAPSNFYENITD